VSSSIAGFVPGSLFFLAVRRRHGVQGAGESASSRSDRAAGSFPADGCVDCAHYPRPRRPTHYIRLRMDPDSRVNAYWPGAATTMIVLLGE